MPENSNSNSNAVTMKHIISGLVSEMTFHPSSYKPSVNINFSLVAVQGVGISGQTQISLSKMEYCLMPLSNGVYETPTGETQWTQINISENISNGIIKYYWSGNNREYLASGVTNPISNSIFINVKDYLPNIENCQMYIRFVLKDRLTGEKNVSVASSGTDTETKTTKLIGTERVDSSIKTTNPYIQSLVDTVKYINSDSFFVRLNEFSPDCDYLAFIVNGSTRSSWKVRNSNNSNVNFNRLDINIHEVLGDEELQDGSYNIKIFARDEYFNYYETRDPEFVNNSISTDVIRATMAPFDCEFNLYAQDGNSRYAGIKINSDGSFTPDRSVNAIFFGNSLLPIKVRIYSNNKEILVPSIDVTKDSNGNIISTNVTDADESLIPDDVSNSGSGSGSGSSSSLYPYFDTNFFDYKTSFGQDKIRFINQINCILNGEDYNISEQRSITIVFRDIAGNETVITRTIVLNNRIFQCAKKNLREKSSEYNHVLMKENSYGAFDTVSESAETDDNNFKRMWEEIYFPEKHGPKMIGKALDLAWARSAYATYLSSGRHNYVDSEEYDIYNMVKDEDNIYRPAYDSQGRLVTIWNASKKYSPYISRNKADIWYRVIDNTGYGDVKVQFERFDMSSSPGDMANSSAGGYKGDVVMVYNADDERCLTKVQNADGSITYPLDGMNTAYMKLLAVYSGAPGGVYDWLSGQAVRTNDTTGAFDETFQCARICIIVCTDSSKERSGFKIKAGDKIGLVYSNYDIDEINGEVWYHGEDDGWGSTDKKIRMFYDYYDSSVSYDYDKGRVILNTSDIPSDAIVTCDYSYYKHKDDYTSEDKTRLFVSSDDDYYDYLIPTVYVTPRNMSTDKSGPVYIPGSVISGKFTDSYWVVDKDRGVLEINKSIDTDGDEQYGFIPFNKDAEGNDTYPMRITMDYIHHAFYRLSNDGYGNVSFEDKVIVADSTPVYPDATWADIRIVNEGDAILESGKLIFKCRGESESGSEEVKRPLDVNRPWDVQEGKKAVTWDRCRVYLSYTYNENYFQFTPKISDLRRTYNAARDNGDGARLTISAEAPYMAPKESLYGRIIWNLAGPTGTNLTSVNYPTDGLTVGRKSWSMEISGKYYVVED